jgi:hypothetical protein
VTAPPGTAPNSSPGIPADTRALPPLAAARSVSPSGVGSALDDEIPF